MFVGQEFFKRVNRISLLWHCMYVCKIKVDSVKLYLCARALIYWERWTSKLLWKIKEVIIEDFYASSIQDLMQLGEFNFVCLSCISVANLDYRSLRGNTMFLCMANRKNLGSWIGNIWRMSKNDGYHAFCGIFCFKVNSFIWNCIGSHFEA